MPGPLLAIAAGAGARLVGAGLSRLIGGRPRIPDLVQPAVNAAQNAITDLETQQGRQLALAEQAAARAGTGSLAGREDIINANARQTAAIRGEILDSIAEANQRQEIVKADVRNQERASLMEGIQSGFNALGGGLTSLALGDPSAALGGQAASAAATPAVTLTQATEAPAVVPTANPEINAALSANPQSINAVQTAGLETLPVDPVAANIRPAPVLPRTNNFAQRMFANLNI